MSTNNKLAVLVRQLQEKLGFEALVTDSQNRYALMVTGVGITLLLRHESQREVFMLTLSGVLKHNNTIVTSGWTAVFAEKMAKIQKDLQTGAANVYTTKCV